MQLLLVRPGPLSKPPVRRGLYGSSLCVERKVVTTVRTDSVAAVELSPMIAAQALGTLLWFARPEELLKKRRALQKVACKQEAAHSL